jgi:hypothetical protein
LAGQSGILPADLQHVQHAPRATTRFYAII